MSDERKSLGDWAKELGVKLPQSELRAREAQPKKTDRVYTPERRPAAPAGARKPGRPSVKKCHRGHWLRGYNLRVRHQKHKNGKTYEKRECRTCAADREFARRAREGR